MTVDQFECDIALGGTGGRAHLAANGQTMPVLHQSMRYVAELRPLAVALFIEAGLWIGRAGMAFSRASPSGVQRGTPEITQLGRILMYNKRNSNMRPLSQQ